MGISGCCNNQESKRIVLLNSKYETDLTGSTKIVKGPNFDGRYSKRQSGYSTLTSSPLGKSAWGTVASKAVDYDPKQKRRSLNIEKKRTSKVSNTVG